MKSNKKIAILDCNNFYVSCERIFDPSIKQKPTVVLSNNDGCVIARSQEIKKMGIKMGTPFFEIKELIQEKDIQVYSSNYNLYGDISDRIMSIIQNIVGKENVEIYSIDEAFIDLTGIGSEQLLEVITNIKNTILKLTGIPVSIGVGPNKTLAKLCNYISKNDPSYNNCYLYENHGSTEEKLEELGVNEIWGIGRQWTKKLAKNNIKNIKQFKNLPQKWVKKNFTVLGEKTYLELHGYYCHQFNNNFKERKIINTSRSFGKPISNYKHMEEALFLFSKNAVDKLKKNNLVASKINVFFLTDRFKEDFIYDEKKIKLELSTDNFQFIWSKINQIGLEIYKKDIEYKKCGITLSDLTPKENVQLSLFSDNEEKKLEEEEKINYLNNQIEITSKPWQLKKDFISQKYTTDWDDLPTAYCS